MKRTITALMALALLALTVTLIASTLGRRASATNQEAGGDHWEYLVVSGPSNVNFSPSSGSSMRKESSGAFAREAFIEEQQMDKLGAKGWELVAVTGERSSHATYYFKRRK
jgi:hypothetical protein